MVGPAVRKGSKDSTLRLPASPLTPQGSADSRGRAGRPLEDGPRQLGGRKRQCTPPCLLITRDHCSTGEECRRGAQALRWEGQSSAQQICSCTSRCNEFWRPCITNQSLRLVITSPWPSQALPGAWRHNLPPHMAGRLSAPSCPACADQVRHHQCYAAVKWPVVTGPSIGIPAPSRSPVPPLMQHTPPTSPMLPAGRSGLAQPAPRQRARPTNRASTLARGLPPPLPLQPATRHPLLALPTWSS